MPELKKSADFRRDAIELHDVVLRWRAEAVAAEHADADLSNVVPFQRVRRDARAARQAPAIAVDALARPAAEHEKRLRWALFLTVSVAAHAALYLPFGQAPVPMASIGLETISVDIVLGADRDAGLENQNGTATASALAPSQAPDLRRQPLPPAEPVDEVARPEATPESPSERTAAEDKIEPATAQEKNEPASAAEKVETPPPTAEQHASVQSAPQSEASGELATSAQPRPVEPVKPATEVIAREEPVNPRRRDVQAPAKRAAKTAKQRRAAAAATAGEHNRSTSTAQAATAAGSVGRGRSDAETNYRGVVAAHLARYKQFPADARSRGEHGRAVVSFSLNGSGGVTAARLVSGSGVPSIDRETVAMVHRASPFPPPPNGRAMSFTVPVNFQLR